MIRDLHPTDGTNPYTRMETLDVDMRVMLIDLGRDEQVILVAHYDLYTCREACYTPPM